jgi:hypothetical protein
MKLKSYHATGAATAPGSDVGKNRHNHIPMRFLR